MKRNVSRVVIVWAALFCPAPAQAVEPAGPQPGAVLGRRLIGREQNGNSFRKPGTLLEQAEHGPRKVDLRELRRRRIAQVAGRQHFNSAPVGWSNDNSDFMNPDDDGYGGVGDDAVYAAARAYPVWVFPVSIGGVALILVVVLRRAARGRTRPKRR